MKKYYHIVLLILTTVIFCFLNSSFAVNTDDWDGVYVIRTSVLDLPWLRGYGKTKDLPLAATLDKDKILENEIINLSDINDSVELYNRFDDFLSMWIGNDLKGYEMQKYIISMALGKDIEKKYKSEDITKFYNVLKDSYYTFFTAQLSVFMKAFDFKYEFKDDKLIFNDNLYENIIKNMTNSKTFLVSYILADQMRIKKEFDSDAVSKAIIKLGYGGHIINYLNAHTKFRTWKPEYFDEEKTLYIIGTKNNDLIKAKNQPDMIYGYDGDDTIYGGAGDDFLHGGDGNDKLYGEDGNDILIGAEDYNRLEGGGGNDIYIYNGNGCDTVIDEKYAKVKIQQWYWDDKIKDYKDKFVDGGQELIDGGDDTIIFGLKQSDFVIKRKGYDLVFITQENQNNILTIKNWYKTSHQRIEHFKFADNTSIKSEDLMNLSEDIISLFLRIYNFVKYYIANFIKNLMFV